MSAPEEVQQAGRPARGGRLPVVGAGLLTVVLVAVAAGLGYWQLEAWQARRALEARDLTQAEPRPLTDVMGADDPFPGDQVGRPVTLGGSWLPEGTLYVEGRDHEGESGYWVVTPLLVDEAAIPVVRGWSPEPEAPEPSRAGSLTGWLQPPEGRTGLTDDDPADDVVPQLRVADAVQRVDVDLYGAYVVLDHERADPGDGSALQPADLEQLPEVSRFTALRNLLYALEWWFFAGFAAYVGWRYTRDLAAERSGSDG